MVAMIKPALAGIGLILLAGCASERVVLLPSTEGRATAVVIRDHHGNEQVLEQPYAASARRLGIPRSYQTDGEAVQSRYAAALAAQPAVPVSFILYFESGSDQLTAESVAEFVRIKQEIAERAAAEIMVIGHTDTLGPAELNAELSMQRAQAVRDLLVAEGLAPEKLELAGRGERELLVPTADEVDEPRNRRVEINIR